MAKYEVKAEAVTELVHDLALRANILLPQGIKKLLEEAAERESLPLAQAVMQDIKKNAELAAQKKMPICQDCGMAVVFVKLGQELQVTGGSLREAIDLGVRRAYQEGYLRKSVVRDPLFERKNTGDNTPAIIHWDIVPGHDIEITISPKGMGSENMSRIWMLKPADGAEGVMKAVVNTVDRAGSNPCPPVVVGIGIGGNFETAPLAAKQALVREDGMRNQNPRYAAMELELLKRINSLGIGPGGCGGRTTALDVRIEVLPTHIAGMPVAVNLCCHALRHASGKITGVKTND